MGMSKITHVVVHYSATYSDQDIGVKEIDAMHKKRGWKGVGYHYVIRRDGRVEKGRPDSQVGAHVARQNSGKLGICYIGGTERSTGPNVGVDTRTAAQIKSLVKLIRELLAKHPGAKVVGHRDLAATQCPGFDVIPWWKAVQEEPGAQPEPAPRQGSTYTVRKGDTLRAIADRHGTTALELARMNDILDADYITVGQSLNVPTAATPVPRTLRRGAKGEAVRDLQRRLRSTGILGLKIDGDFGPATERAVRMAQKQFQLTVDGIAGPATMAALRAYTPPTVGVSAAAAFIPTPTPPRSGSAPQPPQHEGYSPLGWVVGLFVVAGAAAALFLI